MKACSSFSGVGSHRGGHLFLEGSQLFLGQLFSGLSIFVCLSSLLSVEVWNIESETRNCR